MVARVLGKLIRTLTMPVTGILDLLVASGSIHNIRIYIDYYG